MAKEKLKTEGYNELVGKKSLTIWQMLIGQFKDFLIIILIVASLVSAFIGEVTDATVIILIVILNAVLGVVQETKASKALEALKKMAAPEAKLIRDGVITEIPARELVSGDLVLIEAGNYVPADLRLLESVNLKIDESSLTGESVPVEKNANTIFQEETPLGDRANSAFMGTVVTYGRGKGIVVATGMNTVIGNCRNARNLSRRRYSTSKNLLTLVSIRYYKSGNMWRCFSIRFGKRYSFIGYVYDSCKPCCCCNTGGFTSYCNNNTGIRYAKDGKTTCYNQKASCC